MSRGEKITLGTAAVINLLLIFIGRGSFAVGLILAPVLLISMISFVVGLLVLGFGGSSPDGRQFATIALAVGLVAGSCLLSMPIGLIVNQWDIDQAKAFCDRLRPELEHHKSRTGRYPDHWPWGSNAGPLPRLLDESRFYHSDGRFYAFDFTDPSGMLNGVSFDSRTGGWSEWD